MTRLRTLARLALIAVVWPPVHITDRLRGINPAARWSDGVAWALNPQPRKASR